MPTLFETVNNNLQSANPLGLTPQGSDVNQTGQALKLLQAKSGKATAASSTFGAPGNSNLAEQVANNQAAIAQQQIQQQGVMEAQQQLQQQRANEQQAGIANQKLTEQQIDAQDEFTRQQSALLDQWNQGQKQLDFNQDKAKLEQIGFTSRLANQQYVDSLKREGTRSRLDNAASFQDALNRSVFADEEQLFRDNLQFRQMMNSKDRDFKDDLAGMDIDFAMQVASAQNAAANSNMMWTGVGSLPGATAKGVTAYNAQESEKPPTKGNSTNPNYGGAEE